MYRITRTAAAGMTAAVVWSLGLAYADGKAAGTASPGKQKARVEPLLQTKWGQDEPYNGLLPMDAAGNRASIGCGSTSMAQIMKYHRHPKRGRGQSEPYPTKTGTQPSVSFEVDYDWDNMLNKYTDSAAERQRNAVAVLMYHVGVVGFNRNFISGGVVNAARLAIAITDVFGYDRSVQYLYRKYYGDAAWMAIIKEQLNAGLPVFYIGHNSKGDDNHAFVADGYDNAGKVHINWGWDGNHDGYYSLNALNPGRHDFNYNNSIYINIKPDEGGIGGNVMALDGFAVEKTSVLQNEQFTVTAEALSMGFFPGGQGGAALTDNNGNIAAVVGTIDFDKSSILSVYTLTMRLCFVPESVKPGKYRLRFVTRPTGGEWKIVSLSDFRNGVPNAINLTVAPVASQALGGESYGVALKHFSATNTTVSQAEQFTVVAQMASAGKDTFPGGLLGVVLTNNDGVIVKLINVMDLDAITPNTSITSISKNSVPNTVAPGRYRLRILIRPAGVEAWRIATRSLPDVPTSIDITVR